MNESTTPERISSSPPASAEPGTSSPSGSTAASQAASAEDAKGDPTPAQAAVDWHDPRPSFLFFGVVASVALVLDITSKVWAEITLLHRASHPIVVLEDHLNLTLAYNPGGAWGFLQDANEELRKPFFLLVSVAAFLFIVSLYGRLLPGQRGLKWAFPLLLGGALGNLADRITRGQVIDFIDYRADWVRAMNQTIAGLVGDWHVTDHWPTFNIADVALCVGGGLMVVDMFTSRRAPEEAEVGPMTQKSPESTGRALGDAPDR